MVTLQLLVVLSPAYRRPPPGTHPSRFPHHTTTGAANLISMVFRIRHPKRPGVGAPAKGKPCLSKPLPHPPRPSGGGRRPPHKGSKSSKHGFYFYRPKSPGDSSGRNQRPCLSELLPHRDATATPGRPQQPHTAHLLSLDFREMLHNNPPTRPETMLRIFTAQPGKASATLLSHTTGAANLISMVFQIHHPKPPGAGAPAKGKPCLAFLLPT